MEMVIDAEVPQPSLVLCAPVQEVLFAVLSESLSPFPLSLPPLLPLAALPGSARQSHLH